MSMSMILSYIFPIAHPRWVVEPLNTVAVTSRDVIIHCSAEGFPEPVIEWRKQSPARSLLKGSPSSLTFKPINFIDGRLHRLENGSLEIKHVDKSDEGNYMCKATNGIGSGISTVVTLTVRTPAYFKEEFKVETVVKSSPLVIKCEAMGDKPLSISWKKDGQLFLSGSLNDKRYVFTEIITESGLTAQVKVDSSDRRDSSLYTCIATNAYGSDEINLQVIVQGTIVASLVFLLLPLDFLVLFRFSCFHRPEMNVNSTKTSEETERRQFSNLPCTFLVFCNFLVFHRLLFCFHSLFSFAFLFLSFRIFHPFLLPLRVPSGPLSPLAECFILFSFPPFDFPGNSFLSTFFRFSILLRKKFFLLLCSSSHLKYKATFSPFQTLPLPNTVLIDTRKLYTLHSTCSTSLIPPFLSFTSLCHFSLSLLSSATLGYIYSSILFFFAPHPFHCSLQSILFYSLSILPLILRSNNLFSFSKYNYFWYFILSVSHWMKTEKLKTERPDAPSKASIVKVESRSISITWSPPYSGNSPILYYILELKEVTDEDWSMARAVRIPGSETRAQVTGLWPGTSYHFRISAENSLGKSEPGSLLHAITELEGRLK